MTFLNFALWYHKDIDHWMIYHLTNFCEMCRRSLNHFPWINVIPCGAVVDVNVNFDTWIAWQICEWLFLWQNVRVVNLSITHDYLVPSLSFNVSMSPGNYNWKLGIRDVKFRPWFSPVWWYRCIKFESPSKHDTAKKFCWLIATWLLEITAWIKQLWFFAVAFLLSDSIYIIVISCSWRMLNLLSTPTVSWRLFSWARPWENVTYSICEQQRRRWACTSAQSDQRLYCSLLR